MINDTCREFAELVKANDVAKLPESEFEVDPGLREMIEAQIKEEEQTARQASRPHTAMYQCERPFQKCTLGNMLESSR